VAALIALALMGIAFLGLRACTRQMEKPVVHTINDPTDANTVWRADTPLSHAEAIAKGKCPIPLPSEASHIQYVDFYDYGFMRCVRFEACIEVCRSHAAELMRTFNQRMQATHYDLRVPVQSRPLDRAATASMAHFVREEVAEAARAAWFDPDKIAHGEMWGRQDSHTPLVFIDLGRGVFYCLQTD
jgi:hypothetical protein